MHVNFLQGIARAQVEILPRKQKEASSSFLAFSTLVVFLPIVW